MYGGLLGVSLYADDTAFYVGGANPIKINNSMTNAANKFNSWCQMNRLTLNLDKSKVMVFSGLKGAHLKNFVKDIDIRINGEKLEVLQSYKYLGIHLDSGLRFTGHIAKIKQQICYRLYILRKVRWLLGFTESLLLYKSSILCYFDQGDVYYSVATKQELASLQTLQNKCLRVIYGSKKKWPGTDVAHQCCNLLRLGDRRKISLLKYAQTRSYNRANMQRHNVRDLRSNRKLLQNEPRYRTSRMEKSFLVKSIKFWNCLPECIKEIRNFNNFKLRVKTEVLLQKLNFPE